MEVPHSRFVVLCAALPLEENEVAVGPRLLAGSCAAEERIGRGHLLGVSRALVMRRGRERKRERERERAAVSIAPSTPSLSFSRLNCS